MLKIGLLLLYMRWKECVRFAHKSQKKKTSSIIVHIIVHKMIQAERLKQHIKKNRYDELLCVQIFYFFYLLLYWDVRPSETLSYHADSRIM